MSTCSAFSRRTAWLVFWLVLGSAPCLTAATISQQIDPPQIKLGESANLTITVQDGNVSEIRLPQVDGIEIAGTRTQNGVAEVNGSMSSSTTVTFSLEPTHAGDFTIPGFDLITDDGTTLHVHEIKLHVLDTATAPASPNANPSPAPASPPTTPSPTPPPPDSNPPFNPHGPVVMPPGNSAAASTADSGNGPANNPQPNTTDSTAPGFTPPTDSEGNPAKVFVIITPAATEAYVGEIIPMRIEFYIRNDVDYQQDSLPTIDGSDFLMNDLSVRPQEDSVVLQNQGYRCESWHTAIEAPKIGDFPLQMERETYWIKAVQTSATPGDPLGNFFGPRPVLAHQNVPSNRFVIHVHPLPTEGRPASFTGAIGELRVTAEAAPTRIQVGDPVTLHFTVTGEGNFSYIQCPSLAADPNWKAYVPSSKVEFDDESRTQGSKTFEQAVIPKKNGILPLPAASFSYFDSVIKQYVAVPLPLPMIEVTGSIAAATPSSPGADDSTSAAPAAPAAEFLPNRVEIGALQASLAPVYQKPWFWAVQGALVMLLLFGAGATSFRARSNRDEERAEQARRLRSLRQEEDAMSEAVRQGDALAFFLAARHAAQLQLSAQWRLNPEAITLAEVRERDPQLAVSFEPLFTQADAIIYSGESADGLDLAQWELRVREGLQQLQPA